jgi:Protein of unknown function (DUF3105)
VASRQEEKERRRQERLEQEQAAKSVAARKQRLQYVFGGVIGLAVIAAVIVFAVIGIGGGGGGDEGQPKQASSSSDVKLPTQKTGDMAAAAKAAGCKLSNPEIEGATHETKNFKASDYKTNPPTSGNHNPDWYEDGIYEPGTTPRLGMLVHPLEHGRIEVQYRKGASKDEIAQLEALLGEQSDGYHMLMFENTTGMESAVAATAWGHSLTCPDMNDKVFDAIRTFRARYIDKGPETVP